MKIEDLPADIQYCYHSLYNASVEDLKKYCGCQFPGPNSFEQIIPIFLNAAIECRRVEFDHNDKDALEAVGKTVVYSDPCLWKDEIYEE